MCLLSEDFKTMASQFKTPPLFKFEKNQICIFEGILNYKKTFNLVIWEN